MNDINLRQEIIAAARAMNARGLNQGTAGNLSARTDEGLLITPSGVAYEELRPGDIVAMDMEGRADGVLPPSSEWRFHRDILAARPEAGAVLHAHSPFATTLACLGRGIPPFHYMIAVAGGRDIRCAPYATFGTQALADGAVKALEGRRACLLANHGMIAIAGTVAAALALAVEVETLAEQYWRVLQVGEPVLLDGAEIDRVLEKFKAYGRRSGGAGG